MKWEAIGLVTPIAAVILLLEWPKMKKKPKQDRLAFFSLLLFSWALSMFDLPQMTGPIAWLRAIFKPFEQFMEK